MQSQTGLRSARAAGNILAMSAGVVLVLWRVCAADATLESGTYLTAPGATVVESGDNVPGGSRIVPRTATLTFDLSGTQPSLTAVIHDAVLEGGSSFGSGVLGGMTQPFELTVRSAFGLRLGDGSYRFSGDYLRDLIPAGTQYAFDWQFSTGGDGSPVWSGQTYWAGGHLWGETISGVALVPEPGTLGLVGTAAGVLGAFRLLQRSRSTGVDRRTRRVPSGRQSCRITTGKGSPGQAWIAPG